MKYLICLIFLISCGGEIEIENRLCKNGLNIDNTFLETQTTCNISPNKIEINFYYDPIPNTFNWITNIIILIIKDNIVSEVQVSSADTFGNIILLSSYSSTALFDGEILMIGNNIQFCFVGKIGVAGIGYTNIKMSDNLECEDENDY